jgi:2-isopropylmalate synthase
MPYLPLDPKDLGRSYEAVIRVNSQSGKGGISYLLESEYGLELPRRLQIEFSQVVQAVMDASGKELTAREIHALFEREYGLRRHPAPAPAGGVRRRRRCTAWSAVGRRGGRRPSLHGPRAPATGRSTPSSKGWRKPPANPCACWTTTSTPSVRAPTPRRSPTSNCASGRTLFGVGMDANIVSASLKAIVSGLQRAGQCTGRR